MSYKVLITDQNSALAKAIINGFESSESIQLVVLDLKGNIDSSSIKEMLARHGPQVVINTLGWSDLGTLAAEETLIEPARLLAQCCSEQDIILCHFSSHRVFGEVKSGFTESDTPSPTEPCGFLYAAAEKVVSTVPRHMIIRLSWTIGWSGENLLTKILRPMLASQSATVLGERRGSPVAHSDVARVVNALVKQLSCGAENWGIFHYGAGNICTEEELAREIRKRLKERGISVSKIIDRSDKDTQPVSAALGYRRLMDCFGIQPRTWKQGLAAELGLWMSHNASLLPEVPASVEQEQS